MPTIGEDLKAAREKKGLSLTEIAEKTRISHTFLKALEEDDYSVIPGEVFVTGFLRTYSKELGLNVKEIMARYKELRPEKEAPVPEAEEKVQHRPKPSLVSISHRRPRAEKAERKINPVYLIIIGGIILGAVLTGVMLLVTPKEKPLEVKLPAPAPVSKAPAPPVQKPATTAFKPASSFKPHTTATVRPQKQALKAGPLTLKLTADEDSYYSYRADNAKKISGLLKKGMTLDIKADNEIVLMLGNAGGVRANFNGKDLGPFGKHSEVVRGILFTHEKQGVVPPQNAPIKNPSTAE